MNIGSTPVEVGYRIRFETLNSKDTVTWEGKITGIMEPNLAMAFTDIEAYHQMVKKTETNLGDYDAMNYFTLKLDNGTTQAFAAEWISETSLVIIDESNYLDVRIFNIESSNYDSVLAALKDAGFSAKIL